MNPRRVLTALWSALAASQLIYVAILIFLARPTDSQGPQFIRIMTLSLSVVALLQGGGAYIYFRRAAVTRIQEGLIDPTSPEGAARLFPVVIICWVLAESIAIYGLVLRFLSAPVIHCLAFSAIGFLLLFAMRPWQPGLTRPPTSAELASTGRPLH